MSEWKSSNVLKSVHISEGGDGAHSRPPNKAQEPVLSLERRCDAAAASAAEAPPTPPHPHTHWLDWKVGGAESTVGWSKRHQNGLGVCSSSRNVIASIFL
ncbi:unnamed protein product [Tetraodon nigroviridis]|uniref:(spotted green pufferfish) hypothetical protein n=1 Tax=Tetraodon nigroviridis TaxID=99883 RepID=Q4SP40_TETNG|nr:unnamed protein product [Tetraodon nigroviridis]